MKTCECKTKSPLFDDLGIIKCQYCGGRVDEETAKAFKEYNRPIKEGKYK